MLGQCSGHSQALNVSNNGDPTLPRILTTVSDRFLLKCWKKSCAQFALKFKFVVSVKKVLVSLLCRWNHSVWTGWMSWCQMAEIVKQVIKCNRFPDVWKGGIMCSIPRKPRAPSTPEHSRGIRISTAPCTLVGKSWQIGCRPGFGTELPSLFTMEFLAMSKQQQRPNLKERFIMVHTFLMMICELTFLAVE